MTNKVSEERNNVAGAAKETTSISRRRALSLLGLAAATAYVAPTVLSVNQARASDGSGSGGGSGPGSGRGSGGHSNGWLVGSGSGRRRVRRRTARRRRIVRKRTARRRRIFRSIDS